MTAMVYLLIFMAILALILALILVLGLYLFLRDRLHDDTIPLRQEFQGERVMFVFPHPDDEITCAGLLKLLDSQAIPTFLLTLTHGEAGPTSGLIEESDRDRKKQLLAELREKELQSVGELLGIDRLEILDFPDGGIAHIDSDRIKATIREKIAHYQPTLLVTYDDRIGLYGHPDHYLVARYLKEIFLEERDRADGTAKTLYQVTLPQKMTATVLAVFKNLQQKYPLLAEKGLPQPTIAVQINQFGRYKRDTILLHRSQKQLLETMQPYVDKIPPLIYFGLLDKEYFCEIK